VALIESSTADGITMEDDDVIMSAEDIGKEDELVVILVLSSSPSSRQAKIPVQAKLTINNFTKKVILNPPVEKNSSSTQLRNINILRKYGGVF